MHKVDFYPHCSTRGRGGNRARTLQGTLFAFHTAPPSCSTSRLSILQSVLFPAPLDDATGEEGKTGVIPETIDGDVRCRLSAGGVQPSGAGRRRPKVALA